MNTRGWPLLIAGGAFVAAVLKLSTRPRRPMNVAPPIDLSKYAGKWYEIARLPNRFQKKCAGDTTATYTLRPDGRIGVRNECRERDGRLRSIEGTARPAGPNTKLKVTFFWPFRGDYWILDVDPEYRWALVGEPRRRYLWVLSREPRLETGVFERLLDRARQEGYDLERLLRTPQSTSAPDPGSSVPSYPSGR
jgi:apolipoprotein D and lipocalin family protein